ncbi:MAG: cell wall hydrolase [Muricoprocola sp.]
MHSKKRVFFFSLLFVFLLCFTVSVSAQWNTVNGKKKYYVKSTNSYVKSAWHKIDNKWFYFDKHGYLMTGRIKVGDQYYYCDKTEGKLVSQWKNKRYYGKDGVMATNCWIGDSYVDDSGKIIKGTKNPKNPPSQEDIRLLAAITYLEAGNQSYYGKQCVASVVVNRVKSSKFPNTLKGVLYQSGQFTPAMNGTLDALYKSKKKIPSQCMKAAEEILTRGSVLKGYYFFNNCWGDLKVGDHYFSKSYC